MSNVVFILFAADRMGGRIVEINYCMHFGVWKPNRISCRLGREWNATNATRGNVEHISEYGAAGWVFVVFARQQRETMWQYHL